MTAKGIQIPKIRARLGPLSLGTVPPLGEISDLMISMPAIDPADKTEVKFSN